MKLPRLTRQVPSLLIAALALAANGLLSAGCVCTNRAAGELAYERRGDEIMVAGQLFSTGGAPVVLWTDAGGYDAYRVEKRFGPLPRSSWQAIAKDGGPDSAVRYSPRFFRFADKQPESPPFIKLTDQQISQFRGGGWDLPSLQGVVDQFVLHYDVCGVSRTCFRVMHDQRYLSVHFLLDIDGTIYQTLDVKERAWHATSSNDRSVGIEIANMGAYAQTEKTPFLRWYGFDADGKVRITVPVELGDGGVRTPNFVGYPSRPGLIAGQINGRDVRQYDFTEAQYTSLIKLTAALNGALPKIILDYPRDATGKLLTQQLPDPELHAFTGVLGHYHVQDDKVDPGPALDWDRVINGARAARGMCALPAGNAPTKVLPDEAAPFAAPAPTPAPTPTPDPAAISEPATPSAPATPAPPATAATNVIPKAS